MTERKSKDDDSNAYKSLLETLSNLKPPPELSNFIIMENWTPEQRRQITDSFLVPKGELTAESVTHTAIRSGVDVVHSRYIESGTAWMMRKPPPFSPIEPMIQRRIEDAFNRAVYDFVFGTRSAPSPYQWRRKEGESIIAWGDRLMERGLMDSVDNRIAYQKAIWGAMWDTVMNVVGKIRSLK